MAGALGVLLVFTALFPAGSIAHEMPFEKTKLVVVEQDQAREQAVALIFDDYDFTIRDLKNRTLVLHNLKYEAVSRFAYEFAERPQFLNASIASSEKRHWLAIFYEDKGAPATMILILDPDEYQNILTVAKIIAEKEVDGAPEN
jgi:hypothetical protein